MKTLKLNLIVWTVLVAVSVVAAPDARRPAGAAPKRPPTAAASAKKTMNARPVARKSGKGARPARRGDFQEDHMSHEDRRLMKALEDVQSFGEVMHLYPRASRAQSSSVRAALVDAIEEQEERGVNLLAGMISDPDEEVADAAFTAWVRIVEEMRHRRRPGAILEAADAIRRMMEPPPPSATPVVVTQPVVATPIVAQPVVQQ